MSLPEEYRQLLNRVISGEVSVKCKGRTWDEVYAGDVNFDMGGWHVRIFNDCGEIDYTDYIKAPDGRSMDFDKLEDAQADPLRYESVLVDCDVLEKVLKAAK